MNSEIILDKNSLRFWFYRYKDSPLYNLTFILVTIIVCFVLIFRIIIPQMQNWFSIRDEAIATQKRVDTLQNNINYMMNLDKARLNSDLDIANSALPSEKDFAPILQAISIASIKTGVSLEDYSFQVGNISSQSAQLNMTKDGFLNVKLTVVVDGIINKVKLFLKEVEQTLPLSEVINFDGDNQATSITLQFYYKPITNIVFHDENPIKPISDPNRVLLRKLTDWKQSPPPDENTVDFTGSSSAMPLW